MKTKTIEARLWIAPSRGWIPRSAWLVVLGVVVLTAETRALTQSGESGGIKAALRACALLEDGRRFDAAKYAELMTHSDAVVRSRAALALSRLQDPRAVPMLVSALGDAESDVRCDSAFALGQTPTSEGARALLEALESEDPSLRATAAEALGKIASTLGGDAAPLLAALESEKDARVRGALVLALWRGGFAKEGAGRDALLARIDDPSPEVHWRAVYALVRGEAPLVGRELAEVLTAPARDAEGYARLFAARGLGQAGAFPKGSEDEAVFALTSELHKQRGKPFDPASERVTSEVLHALSKIAPKEQPRGEPAASASWILQRHDVPASLRFRAVEYFEVLTNRPHDRVGGLPVLLADAPDILAARFVLTSTALQDPSAWVRARAFAALVATADSGEFARLADRALVTEGPIAVREAFLTSLSSREANEALPRLTRAFEFEDVRTRTAVAEAIRNFGDHEIAHALARRALAIDDLAIRGAAVLSVGAWEDPAWSDALLKVYDDSSRFDLTEVRASVVRALAAIESTDLAFFERALRDPEPMVRRAAATVIEERTDREIPVAKLQECEPDEEGIAAVALGIDPRVVFETTRGAFEVTLYPEAPLHARALIDRARRGFYDGLPLHRIVPNFVVQGGDPRGDGWGGLDTFVREQWSRRPFDEGVVGMPTAGKDTGGCQIFVTLIPTPHLDGRYTAFGEVSSGMDVIRRLEKGDRILSTSLRR